MKVLLLQAMFLREFLHQVILEFALIFFYTYNQWWNIVNKLNKDDGSSSNKLWFNDSNYVAWKLKIRAIRVKDWCLVAWNDKEKKIVEMKYRSFCWEWRVTYGKYLSRRLTLDEIVLFNVYEETSVKESWDKLQNMKIP